MSLHYAILEDRPDQISRLRFLLHLRGIQALLAMDANEAMNWRSACRQAEAKLCGVILYCEEKNVAQLKALADAGFDLPVYAIRVDGRSCIKGGEGLDLFVGTVEDVLKQLPSLREESAPGLFTPALQTN